MRETLFNKEVEQVLLGSLMGDACLVKTRRNAFLKEEHSTKERDYVNWKGDILKKEFRISRSVSHRIDEREEGTISKRDMFQIFTNSDERLNGFFQDFYPNAVKPNSGDKIILKKYLKKLTPLGLAIWYCDDGSYHIWNRTINFSTHRLHLKVFIEFFESMGFKPKYSLLRYKDTLKYKNKKDNYQIRFNREFSEKFLNIVRPFILKMPKCMHRKLGDKEKIEEAKIKKKDYEKRPDRIIARGIIDKKYKTKNRVIINKKRMIYYYKDIKKSRENALKSYHRRKTEEKLLKKRIYMNKYRKNKKRLFSPKGIAGISPCNGFVTSL